MKAKANKGWSLPAALRKLCEQAFTVAHKAFKGLAASLDEVMPEIVSDALKALAPEAEAATPHVLTAVKYELIALALKCGFTENEDYAKNQVGLALARYREANGIASSTRSGRPVYEAPAEAYRIVVDMFDRESGRGSVLQDKTVKGIARILSDLHKGETTVKRIRAKAVKVTAKAEAEAEAVDAEAEATKVDRKTGMVVAVHNK